MSSAVYTALLEVAPTTFAQRTRQTVTWKQQRNTWIGTVSLPPAFYTHRVVTHFFQFYLSFPSIDCNPCRTGNVFSSRDLELWPITSTFQLDPDSVKMNQHVKYLVRRFS